MESVLNVNPDLIYADPKTLVDGYTNLQSFKPYQSTFNAGDTMEIKIVSNSEFIYPKRSFLKFKITPAVQDTLSVLGASSVIDSIQDVVGGVSAYPVHSFNLLKACDIETDTVEKKTLHHVSSGYLPEEYSLGDKDANATSGSCMFSASKVVNAAVVVPTTGLVFCVPLPTQLQTAQPLPLPFIQGGVSHNITFAPMATVFPAGTATSYTVSEVELIATMLQPRDELLIKYQELLSQGGSLVIPFTQVSAHSFAVNAADTNNVKLNIGWRKSVNNVIVCHRAKAATTAERFSASKIQLVKDWYIMSGSQRYPRNFNIPVSTAQVNPWVVLASISTDAQSLSLGYIGKPKANDRSFLYYNFKSNPESFDNGIELSDGYLELLFNYASNPAADDVCNCFVEFDSVLEIDANRVRIKA